MTYRGVTNAYEYVSLRLRTLTHYCLKATIVTVLSKFLFSKKEGIKKIPMSTASISR